jgi:predicted Zn-dependent protease
VIFVADTIRSIAHLSAYGRDWRLPAHVRGLVWLARGAPERAATEFRAALFSPNDGFTRTNLELARTLLTLERPNEAVAILQPALRGSVDGSNFYVTRIELHEMLARAFEAAHQPDSAAAHYAVVASVWSSADPPLRERGNMARRMAAIVRERKN